jgi:branched-chain amino acid aminotransferase
MRFIFDGQLQEGAVAVAPGSRGLRYGDGLFETMRLKEGRLLFFARHMERLSLGLELMQLAPELGDLRGQVAALAAANGCGSSARVRLNVFRGEGPLFQAAAGSCHYILEAAPLDAPASLNHPGLHTGIFDDIRRCADRYSRLKTNNYLASCMGARHAARQGWDEALLLNAAGRIAESCTANLFILENDVLYTPPLPEGCVAGVMRDHLLHVLPVRGIAVREEPVSLERVAGAEEVFLTNVIKGVQPVSSVGEHTYAVRFSRQVHAWAESSAW